MSSIFDKDKVGLEDLMAKATICWGEVTRLARDADGQSYMVIILPMMQQHQISGGEKCVIFADEADADNVNPRLINLMGRKVPFIITGFDEEEDRLLCSRKKAQEALKASMLQGLQSGQVYEGRLTGFSQYGGYIEVNGVTGHIRNSDFSEDHSDIREYLKAGDKVEVKCKEISSEGYIFWEVVSKVRRSKPIEHDFERDTIVLGRVARISNFPNSIGVFVNLKLGIDALCPLPRDIEIEEGSRVTMKIETITPGLKPTDPPRIRGHIVSAV